MRFSLFLAFALGAAATSADAGRTHTLDIYNGTFKGGDFNPHDNGQVVIENDVKTTTPNGSGGGRGPSKSRGASSYDPETGVHSITRGGGARGAGAGKD